MIRRATAADGEGVTRTVQIECDTCGTKSPALPVVAGSAMTEDALLEEGVAIAQIWSQFGFVEQRPGVLPPDTELAELPVRDLCRACFERRSVS